MTGDLVVFGYGSLMYEPAVPEALMDLTDGTLDGWARAFDKRSRARGCAASEALRPTGLPGWEVDGWRWSLCLGTERQAGAALHGKVLRYRADQARRVLAELDRREGVVDGADPASQGYRRVALPVDTAEGSVRAVVYVTNVGGVHHAPGLAADEVARVLAHATPREAGSKARGARYLLEAAEVLARVGVRDVGIEGLVAAVRAELGAG